MVRDVGVWIDHRKAMIVFATEKGEEMRLVISKVEKQPRRLPQPSPLDRL